MTDLKVQFGRRLKAIRKRRKLTQEALGSAAKLDYKHIWSIEKGKNAPSFEAMGRLAKALKVQPFEFFLPEEMASGKAGSAPRQVVLSLDRLHPATVKVFFDDLLEALGKLEQGK